MGKLTGALGFLLVASSAMAPAATISWNMSGPDIDLGMIKTFTSSSGSIPITAYGFSGPAAAANAQLFGKNDGGDEVGLGLDLNNDGSHEITGTGFIQLDVSALAGKVTDFMFVMESTTSPDGWKILGSNTLGSIGSSLICSPSVTLCSGTDEGVKHTINPNPVGTFKYLTFEATYGTVLLGVVSADTQSTPEPATLVLVGAGLLGLGALGRLKSR
jgi:PEP-CTERM motif-containing protein